MHYRNGREAKNGDKILLLQGYSGSYGTPVVGILFDAKAEQGSDCNGWIAPVSSGGLIQCADLKNCLHLDDIAAATIPDTSPKPPEVAAPAAAPAPPVDVPAPTAAELEKSGVGC